MDDPDQRVELLVNHLRKETGQVLLVGSSMGAYVALVAAEKLASEKLADEQPLSSRVTIIGVFLLAPALYLPGYQLQDFAPCSTPLTLVQGWLDEVTPAANAIRFAKVQQCSLHLIPGDHRLNSSLHLVEPLFNQFMGFALANPANVR